MSLTPDGCLPLSDPPQTPPAAIKTSWFCSGRDRPKTPLGSSLDLFLHWGCQEIGTDSMGAPRALHALCHRNAHSHEQLSACNPAEGPVRHAQSRRFIRCLLGANLLYFWSGCTHLEVGGDTHTHTALLINLRQSCSWSIALESHDSSGDAGPCTLLCHLQSKGASCNVRVTLAGLHSGQLTEVPV